MATYQLQIKSGVEKDLRKLPLATAERVLDRIDALAEVPLPRQSAKLAGAEHLH